LPRSGPTLSATTARGISEKKAVERNGEDTKQVSSKSRHLLTMSQQAASLSASSKKQAASSAQPLDQPKKINHPRNKAKAKKAREKAKERQTKSDQRKAKKKETRKAREKKAVKKTRDRTYTSATMMHDEAQRALKRANEELETAEKQRKRLRRAIRRGGKSYTSASYVSSSSSL